MYALRSFNVFVFYGRKMLSISESIDDMEAYTQLNDQVYYRILHSTDPALEEVSNHGNQHPVCVANITVKCKTISKGKWNFELSESVKKHWLAL